MFVKKEEILKQLDSYLTLEADWDSYDAAPFKPKVIQRAKEILSCVYDYAHIKKQLWQYPGLRIDTSPCGNGSVDIYLDWRGFECIINVDDEETCYFFFAPEPYRKLDGTKTAWDSATAWVFSEDKVAAEIPCTSEAVETILDESIFKKKWSWKKMEGCQS